ncbi:MAG: hypothetical protein Kow0068_05420 [Marinilabiliales bacterium]
MKNNFKFYFTKILDEEIKSKINEFLQVNQYGSIEQNPDWFIINNIGKQVVFFYVIENDRLVGFCNILESRFLAKIHLGPICINKEVLIKSIYEIRKYYKNKGKAQLEVQLGILTSQETDYIEYELYKILPFVQRYDVSNWSSMIISLNQSIDEIFNNFKQNHKSSINKAIKNNIYTKKLNNINEIKKLSEIYDKMYEVRKIKRSFNNTQEVFIRLSLLFKEQNNGIILGVFNQQGQMLGGVIYGISNGEMYYKYGATDPDYRKLPILHLAIYDGIKIGIKEGISVFNFGGYNHFVKGDSQIAGINFFKNSFNGEFVFYPKKMYFKLNKLKCFLYNILKFAYYKINKNIN